MLSAVAGANAQSSGPALDQPAAPSLPEAQPPAESSPLPPTPMSAEEAAAQRSDLLDSLFAQLHSAEDETSAAIFQEAVLQLWSRSGSPTVDVLIGQAQRAARVRQYQKALSILDTAVEILPEFPELWNRRATVLFLQGDPDRAVTDIERVLELEPRHFGALAALGMILRSQGDTDAALDAFKRALEINPFLKQAKEAVRQLEKEAGQPI